MVGKNHEKIFLHQMVVVVFHGVLYLPWDRKNPDQKSLLKNKHGSIGYLRITLPKTNIVPENQWDWKMRPSLLGPGLFSSGLLLLVSGRI